MNKIIFIFAAVMLFSAKVNATDRDCAQYSSSEAVAATSDSSTNSVSIVFSGMTARKGTTNADCATSSAGGESGSETTGSGTQTTGGNENSSQETGSSQTPEEEPNCPGGNVWTCDNNGTCRCVHDAG